MGAKKNGRHGLFGLDGPEYKNDNLPVLNNFGMRFGKSIEKSKNEELSKSLGL